MPKRGHGQTCKRGCVNLLTVLWPNQNDAISQVEIESL